jgi:hypothetical protein
MKERCHLKNHAGKQNNPVPSQVLLSADGPQPWPHACSTVVWTRVDSESRFAIFLARILWKMRLASRENISESLASLTSLTRREKCDILSS